MNTTNLFVELLVIGIGGAIWILLILFSIFQFDSIDLQALQNWSALLPFLGFVYVLSIVLDRASDTFLRQKDSRL
jgi:hypothetical protein